MPFLLLATAAFAFLIWKHSQEETEAGGGFGVEYDLSTFGLDMTANTSVPRAMPGVVNRVECDVDCYCIGRGLYLECDAALAFLLMAQAAASVGVTLVPSGPRSAFRTSEQQASLQDLGTAAPVNHSKHQAGLCIDLETAGGTNDAYQWLKAHAATYGFVGNVPSEPWHWEFCG